MPSLDEILNRKPMSENIGVPPTTQPSINLPVKKLLIVLSFWDGDRDFAASLCRLIADIQDRPSPEADFMLYARNDARPMDADVVSKLGAKFGKVHQHRCRRMNAKGYPYGPNEMFYDLIEFFRQENWRKQYYAFLNMEADCTPLAPDWIWKLANEYRIQSSDGITAAIGHVYHVQANLPDHLNGAAIYSMEFFEKAGGMEILGGPGSIAYDFHHAKRILPIAKDTPLMVMDFARKTITARDLFSIQKMGQFPAYLHGVKDLSAQTAVRARFIDKTGESDLASKTITTYFDPTVGSDVSEQQACLEVWKDAWKEEGWNPIVNNRYDAAKNTRYEKVKAQISNLPKQEAARIYRWLAFEHTGGGVHCDIDVLPRRGFTPNRLTRQDGVTVMGLGDTFVQADREGLADFMSGKRDAVKTLEIVKDIGSEGWLNSQTVHFSRAACSLFAPGSPKSRVMIHFFRAKQ